MVEAAGIEPASESLQMILKALRRLKPRLKPSPDFPPSFQKTKGENRPPYPAPLFTPIATY